MNKSLLFILLICPFLLSCSISGEEPVIPTSPTTPTAPAENEEGEGEGEGEGEEGEGEDGEDDTSNSSFKILFIGNSLTYSNDLPKLVEDNAKAKGITIETSSITRGNYAIIDHWEDGDVQVQISTGQFDFVIIQQGPSSQPYGREVLIEYGKLYKDLCDINGAELAYFMVWPSRTYYYTFDGVIKNHRDAATINNALLCPVGEVWKQYFDATSNFDYYGPDGFHPSLKGSEVAADVIVDSLF